MDKDGEHKPGRIRRDKEGRIRTKGKGGRDKHASEDRKIRRDV